jgi:hypothetical protein
MNPIAEISFALAFIVVSIALVIAFNKGNKCKCGGKYEYDGYHDVCNKCGKRL